ncbi:hypothetical protein [Campylobacter lari]|uniref:hypothetical protein n=1 Tax=Campylobacter lari TaxID=201 RepID=UPI00372B8974
MIDLNKGDKKYFVSSRPDGLCIRLCSMILAIFCSKKTHYGFAFKWNPHLTREEHEYKNLCLDYKLNTTEIENKELVFDQSFIERYHVNDNIKDSYGSNIVRRNQNFSNVLRVNSEEKWGWYMPSNFPAKWLDLKDNQEFRFTLAQCYKDIIFSERYQNIIKVANVDFEFVAYHMRSGDCVFSKFKYFPMKFSLGRFFPYEIAFQMICKSIALHDTKIILFGEDDISNIKLLECIKKYGFSIDNILLSKQQIKDKISVTQTAFFDVNLMSRASVIYSSGESSFARLAYYISGKNKLVSYKSIYNDNAKYNIILSFIDRLETHKWNKAMSYFYLSRLACHSGEKLFFLKMALRCDPDNASYHIFYILELIKLKKMRLLEIYIRNRVDIKQLIYVLLIDSKTIYKKEIENLLAHENIVKAGGLYDLLCKCLKNTNLIYKDDIVLKKNIENFFSKRKDQKDKIAYIHIGTAKTGTTSIQNFLFHNQKVLQKKGYFFPQSIGKKNHVHLPGCVYSIKKMNGYRKVHHLQNDNIFMDKQKEIINNLSKELSNMDCGNTIFSSESIHASLNYEELVRLKNTLYAMGFDKIKILVYFRDIGNMLNSLCSEDVKCGFIIDAYFDNNSLSKKPFLMNMLNYKENVKLYSEIFGKENLIVRLFDKNEFYQGDLLKDFIHSIGLEWDDEFIIPPKQNESLDLLGIELFQRFNRLLPRYKTNSNNLLRGDVRSFIEKHFNNTKERFFLPKEIIQSYIDYFEESNEWVRKEFFPHKERLFPEKDLSNYKENYELKEMKPEYWDKIAEFIADIVKTKNQNIIDKTNIIQNLNSALPNTTKENAIKHKLFFQTKYGTAKTRIQNQLSYKLGQAMIVNSKSILGYIRMPFVLSYIKDKHKQEQKNYQEKIKKDPSLKLPPLEDYPDYQEALKLKNHLSYKLGQALIKANKTWYKGGYAKMWFEIRKLKREIKNKKG